MTLDVVATEVIVAFEVVYDTIDELGNPEVADDSFEVLGVLKTVDDNTGLLATITALDDTIVELETEATGLDDAGEVNGLVEEPILATTELLWGTIEVTVTTLTTTTLELDGVAEDTGVLDELLTTTRVFDGTMLEAARIEVPMFDEGDAMLDEEDVIVEGVTLKGVETEDGTELIDRLLDKAEDAVDEPTLELIEVPCDTGRIFVATLTTTVLVAVVKTTMG